MADAKRKTINALKFTIEQFEKHDMITVTCSDYFTTMLKSALKLLTEEKITEPEVEGSDYTWWYVCGECHGAIGDRDAYCKHCGAKLLWNKK